MTPGGARPHALLLADHIYRDAETGKHVIAGTFSHASASGFPATVAPSLFVALSGIRRRARLAISVVAAGGAELAAAHGLDLICDNPDELIELAVPLPPLAVPEPGRYEVHVTVDDEPLGTAPFVIQGPPTLP